MNMNIMKYARNRAVITGSLYWHKIREELGKQNVQYMNRADYFQMVRNNPEIQLLYGEYVTYCNILELMDEDRPELREYAQEDMEYINKVVQD